MQITTCHSLSGVAFSGMRIMSHLNSDFYCDFLCLIWFTSGCQGSLSKTHLTTLHLDSAANPWHVISCASWAQSSTKQMVGNMNGDIEWHMKRQVKSFSLEIRSYSFFQSDLDERNYSFSRIKPYKQIQAFHPDRRSTLANYFS